VRGGRLALAGWGLFAGGCADRGLASGPTTAPGSGTWVVVGVAGAAVAIVLAALVILPARRPGGSDLAAWVLAVQAGAAVIGGAVIVGAALRTGSLLTQPDRTEQAASLLRLSGLDGGNQGFFRLMAATTIVLGSLLVSVLVLSARGAAGTDPLERALATAVLAVEGLASAGAVAWVLLGAPPVPITIGAATLPILVASTVAARPRQEGYNGTHG